MSEGEHDATGAASAWTQDWRRWRREREQAVLGPHGIASLTGTHWLRAEPQAVPGLPGTWHAADGAATDGTLVVRPGDHVALDERELTATTRDGQVALRVLDPQAPTRTALAGIDAFEPDPAWVVEGRFEPAAPRATASIDHVDGHAGDEELGGTVHVRVAGHDLDLLALAQPEGRLQVVLGDAANGTTTQQFRFLSLVPEADGRVVVDLNRSYLPPCAFTDHYLCPMPPPQNRLPFAVEAGETFPRRR